MATAVVLPVVANARLYCNMLGEHNKPTCKRYTSYRYVDYFFSASGPIGFVLTTNSSIHSFCACGTRPGPKKGVRRN